MSYLISFSCVPWPMLPRSVKSGLTSTKPRKIKKVTVMQYSDLFWCGRGDSASRALKTVRRTVFARRDADGGHGLFESPLAASHTISYKTKKQHPKECCSWCGRGDSNLWPLESENCGIRQYRMIQRRNLCGMHKFPRWLLYDTKQR